MKVIVATCAPPFVRGGASMLVDSLAKMIRREGHEVELLTLPFSSSYAGMLDQMLAIRLLDLSDRGDRLITIRTPSHLLRHPSKVIWFIHHHRGAYDLWGTPYQDIPATPEGLGYRDAIRAADLVGFREATRVFCNSRVVAGRLREFNGIEAEVLYPPLPEPERYRMGGLGDYVLYVSRLTHHKRQWLALEALRYARTPVRLMIVGEPDPDSADYARELMHVAESAEYKGRVSVVPRWVSDEEKIGLLADCLAAAYFPFNEDSYGYPSLEAHHSGKAVLTTSDAGGTLELIVDGHNGRILPPEAQAIGQAMDELYLEREQTRRMGEAGYRRIAELGISQQRVIDKLLA